MAEQGWVQVQVQVQVQVPYLDLDLPSILSNDLDLDLPSDFVEWLGLGLAIRFCRMTRTWSWTCHRFFTRPKTGFWPLDEFDGKNFRNNNGDFLYFGENHNYFFQTLLNDLYLDLDLPSNDLDLDLPSDFVEWLGLGLAINFTEWLGLGLAINFSRDWGLGLGLAIEDLYPSLVTYQSYHSGHFF